MKKIVILITVDALRADVCGFSGYKETYTPNLDNLSLSFGTTFLNTYASGVATPMSFPGIMCGLYPTEIKNNIIPKYSVTLAQKMKKLGYETVAVVSSNPYLTPVQGYDRGFDSFLTVGNRYKNKNHSVFKSITRKKWFLGFKNTFFGNVLKNVYRHTRIMSEALKHVTNSEQFDDEAKKTLDVARTFIGKNINRLFIWIHLMDVHFPYRLPNSKNILKSYSLLRKRKRWNSKGENIDKSTLDSLLRMYTYSVEYVDSEVSNFIRNVIKEFGENALVILTSDHGEEFMERGHLNHFDNPYQEIAKVPLVIFDKNNNHNVIDKMTSLSDLKRLIIALSTEQYPLKANRKPYLITETTPFLSKGELVFPFKDHKIALRTKNETYVFDSKSESIFYCNRKKFPSEERLIEINNNKIKYFFKKYIAKQRNKVNVKVTIEKLKRLKNKK